MHPYQDDFLMRAPVTERPEHPAVLIVLESPYGEEFVSTVGPAKGRIGVNIRAYLETILEDRLGLEGLHEHGLIIMHAVQYQCSLGVPGASVRSQVFRRVWNAFGEQDFRERFSRTFRFGDIVVNACPKGDTDDPTRSVRRLVEKVIAEVRGADSDVRIAHPLFWSVPRNRALHWD